MTFGDRTREFIRHSGAAEPLDRGLQILAGILDPTDTDEGAERVSNELHGAIVSAICSLAARRGWDLASGASVRVAAEPSEAEWLANDLCGDVVADRDRLRRALERADELLMAANGALGRAFAASRPIRDQVVLEGALQDVQARLAAVSDTTLTALQPGPSATSEGEPRG